MFARGEQRLALARAGEPDATVLSITSDTVASGHHALAFATHLELVRYQADFEDYLADSGWRLFAFSCDRRASHAPACLHQGPRVLAFAPKPARRRR